MNEYRLSFELNSTLCFIFIEMIVKAPSTVLPHFLYIAVLQKPEAFKLAVCMHGSIKNLHFYFRHVSNMQTYITPITLGGP